ncbi:tripartite tricarboxylate transporter substrate binding protein [Saccharomonospora sp. NPDC046836]|uniref:tripartite tricarboxylate transporter substrate binding protein n=1 Tax=Saccharomonospora sp. NPDC046836 TaxID=3156921 RepID=UPI00340FD64F
MQRKSLAAGGLTIVMAVGLSGCGGVLGAGGGAGDGDDYPSKHIELIVPASAGGTTDVQARLWASCLEDELGESIVAINQETAHGVTGGRNIAHANPDGYTLGFVGTAVVSVIPVVDDQAGYAAEDLQVVAQTGSTPDVVYVRADSPIDSMEELLGTSGLKAGQYGPTSATRHRLDALIDVNSLSWTVVPFESQTAILQGLLRGDIEVGYDSIGAPLLEQARSGEIKILASGLDIKTIIPDVPTFESLGVEGFAGPSSASFYLAGPAGMPDGVTERLEGALAACRDSKAISAMTEVLALPEIPMGEEVADVVREEFVAYKEQLSP